jgi:hypothetical protein
MNLPGSQIGALVDSARSSERKSSVGTPATTQFIGCDA